MIHYLRLGESQPLDTQVKTALDAALEILKNARCGGNKGDKPVAPTAVDKTTRSDPLHRSSQFDVADIPSTTTPEQVGTLKAGLNCLQFLNSNHFNVEIFGLLKTTYIYTYCGSYIWIECMTLPLQMLPDRQPEHSEPAPSPTAPTPTPPALEEPAKVEGPPNRELELAGLQSLMKQHEAVQNSLAINTPKVEINWSTHRKEGMRLKRLMEESPNGVDFPHMVDMWQGSAAATWLWICRIMKY